MVIENAFSFFFFVLLEDWQSGRLKVVRLMEMTHKMKLHAFIDFDPEEFLSSNHR